MAQDRIWPSEWAVQALFTLDWNSDKAWDESVLVGGFNDFGRRPTAIVEANLGGSIGAVDRNGYKIQEAVWQFLERRCWHTDDRTADRQSFSASSKFSWPKIMNLPGRQRLPESSSFKVTVTLKVDPTVRGDRPRPV